MGRQRPELSDFSIIYLPHGLKHYQIRYFPNVGIDITNTFASPLSIKEIRNVTHLKRRKELSTAIQLESEYRRSFVECSVS